LAFQPSHLVPVGSPGQRPLPSFAALSNACKMSIGISAPGIFQHAITLRYRGPDEHAEARNKTSDAVTAAVSAKI